METIEKLAKDIRDQTRFNNHSGSLVTLCEFLGESSLIHFSKELQKEQEMAAEATEEILVKRDILKAVAMMKLEEKHGYIAARKVKQAF